MQPPALSFVSLKASVHGYVMLTICYPPFCSLLCFPEIHTAMLERLGLGGRKAGIKHEEAERGFDHAAFVPLKLMYPAADVPIVSLSLLSSMDAQVSQPLPGLP